MNPSNANFVNRTLFHGDNLDFLKAINTATIDLIATDPPFNKGKDFYATTPEELKKEERKKVGYQDRWTWDETDINHAEWVKKIKDYSVDVYHVIEGSRLSYGDDMGAFLCFMTPRLMEMKRVLKDTGSIYLHCDTTASHYLKMLMDAIFGKDNFQNEIIWHYTNRLMRSSSRFSKLHDSILYYTVSNKYTYNPQYDENWTPSNTQRRRLEKGWEVRKGDLIIYDNEKFNRENMDVSQFKNVYYDAEASQPAIGNVWEMPILNPMSKERKSAKGYPTQKPIALYKRIIEASSNPGDVVLDPFCGCASTLLAAEKFKHDKKRQWLGIDIWEEAHELVISRLVKEGLMRDPEGKVPHGMLELIIPDDEKITYMKEPPNRTDDGKEAAPSLKVPIAKTTAFKALRNPEKIRKELIERDGQTCQGCDRPFADVRYLEIDHNMPRKDGGTNELNNLVLLCSPCNRKKSYKFTLSGLRNENKKDKHMWGKGMPI